MLFSCVHLFCDPTDYSLPGSSVHGIFQARILEWVAISFSRGFSWPRDWTWVREAHPESRTQDKSLKKGWTCCVPFSDFSSLFLNRQDPTVSLGFTYYCASVSVKALISFSCDSFHFNPEIKANSFSYTEEYNGTNPNKELPKMQDLICAQTSKV